MALGIYKPGQGYWVRVLTATFAGVMLLAASAWLWGQLELASGWIPVRQWEVVIRPADGTANPGDRVELFAEAIRAGESPVRIGQATVLSTELIAAGVRVELGDVQFERNRDITQARMIAPPTEGATASLSGPIFGTPVGKRLFEPLFLQAGGVAVLILLGAVIIYYFVGAKPGSSEFLIATDGEMKKVNWSTRRDIIGSTWVVIVWSAMIASGLFIVDLAFSRFFILIGVLER